MRSLSMSRLIRGKDCVWISECVRRAENLARLGLAAGMFVGVLVACYPGYAQPGMPNSSGAQPTRTSTPSQAQTNGTAQPRQTTGTAQRAQRAATVQRARTAGVQRPRAKATVQHAQIKPAAQRVQIKTSLPRTVGTDTAAKPTKPAITKTAMPLPTAGLLEPPSQPDCAFDKSRTDADERQKLDYERQCYRHAEMIVRARLERLQGDVEQMVKAAKSGERLSATR